MTTYKIRMSDCTGAILGLCEADTPEAAMRAALASPGILKRIRHPGYADYGFVRRSGDPGLSGIFQITAHLKKCKEYGAARAVVARVHVGYA